MNMLVKKNFECATSSDMQKVPFAEIPSHMLRFESLFSRAEIRGRNFHWMRIGLSIIPAIHSLHVGLYTDTKYISDLEVTSPSSDEKQLILTLKMYTVSLDVLSMSRLYFLLSFAMSLWDISG
jgi:hypothetical protein